MRGSAHGQALPQPFRPATLAIPAADSPRLARDRASGCLSKGLRMVVVEWYRSYAAIPARVARRSELAEGGVAVDLRSIYLEAQACAPLARLEGANAWSFVV